MKNRNRKLVTMQHNSYNSLDYIKAEITVALKPDFSIEPEKWDHYHPWFISQSSNQGKLNTVRDNKSWQEIYELWRPSTVHESHRYRRKFWNMERYLWFWPHSPVDLAGWKSSDELKSFTNSPQVIECMYQEKYSQFAKEV